MHESVYRGTVFCENKSWVTVFVKPPGSFLEIHCSGSWQPNRHWGPVDYHGHPTLVAGPSYRGPGKPEGCMLIRVGDGPVEVLSSNPLRLAQVVAGEIHMACNDDPNGLKDNKGQIDYVLTYLAPPA